MLLVTALVLVAVLVLNAQYAAQSHRALAEDVLRDYAALAGDEALRRVTVEVAFYGFAPVIELLRALDPDGPAPSIEKLTGSADSGQRRGLELVRRTFIASPTDDALSIDGPPVERPVRDWLLREAIAGSERLTERVRFGVLHGELEGRPVSFVYAPIESQGVGRVVGFEVANERLSDWAQIALARRPLLPPALGDGELGNDALYMRLIDASQREIYRSGERYLSALVVERRPAEDLPEFAEGLAVQVAVDPAAAPKLVIGGLPRSRLPVLIGLLAVTVGLVAVAVVLMRRERALTRLRSDFVSRVSHELRTPLTQIRMFAETLRLDRVRDVGERRRALEIIDRESRRLSALVENVLRFSRAERGSGEFTPRSLPLAPLLTELVEDFRPLLAEGGRVALDVPADLEIRADEDALHQALLNLLDNAAKYGPPTQEIRVGAAATNGTVRLWVDDEGHGIPIAERQRVWEPFRRVTDGAQATPGTGIGLSVVREIVEQHDGECWVEEGARGGTRVVLELSGVLDGETDP